MISSLRFDAHCEMLQHLQSQFPSLQYWANTFLCLSEETIEQQPGVSASSALKGHGRPSPSGGSVFVGSRRDGAAQIKTVLATEESVSSRTFGLKGKVDATVIIRYQPPTNPLVTASDPSLKQETGLQIVPLEVVCHISFSFSLSFTETKSVEDRKEKRRQRLCFSSGTG